MRIWDCKNQNQKTKADNTLPTGRVSASVIQLDTKKAALRPPA